MKITRPGQQAFQEQVAAGSGHSVYLKASEDFTTARRLRIIPWVFGESVIDVMMLQEGWHVKTAKDDKGKTITKSYPFRLAAGEPLPEGIEWAMSKAFGDQKPRKQTPVPAVYFLAFDYRTNEIKLAGFTQAGFNKVFSSLISEKNQDGSDNEGYVPDFTAIDVLIQRVDEKSWSVTTSEKNGVNLSKDAINAMSTFKWDWQAFMRSEAPMEDEAPGFHDWSHMLDGEEAAPKVESKPAPAAKLAASNNTSGDWRQVKTPQGVLLGDQNAQTLEKYKTTMEGLKNFNPEAPLYKAIVAGLTELSAQEDGNEAEALF